LQCHTPSLNQAHGGLLLLGLGRESIRWGTSTWPNSGVIQLVDLPLLSNFCIKQVIDLTTREGLGVWKAALLNSLVMNCILNTPRSSIEGCKINYPKRFYRGWKAVELQIGPPRGGYLGGCSHLFWFLLSGYPPGELWRAVCFVLF
jgi:hypothetical protein